MRIIRKRAAAKKFDLAPSSFDDIRRHDATFPKAILLGARSIGFFEDELDAWIAARPRVGVDSNALRDASRVNADPPSQAPSSSTEPSPAAK